MSLLEVENLGTWFYTRQGIVKAVDGVKFEVASGEKLAIVGESGCGKSMTALSLMRLIPDPPGRIVSGSIKLGGRDLLELSEEEMRKVRGNEISMIFQEPMTSLNPVMTIGKQIAEALVLHRDMNRKAALKRAVEMLDLVRIPEPYPSWGRMLSESAAEYVRTAPWLVIFPGIAISLTVFGTNLLGDALRDILDPRQRS